VSEIDNLNKKLERAEQRVRILEEMIETRTRELYTTNIELERQNKELEQFVYIASHDLREPLRTVKSFTELLQEDYKGKLDENAEKYVQFISQGANRMSALIDGLLQYSRLNRDKEMTIVDCNALIKAVLDDLSTSVTETHAILDIGELPKLKGYETDLRLLFQNLLTNAIKFRKKDTVPHIKISAIKQDVYWMFSFQDNGIGIAKRNQEKIFAIFQRLHSKSDYEGTGIGLAHCQKIVDLHGGKISVESELGKGSTFYFSIPI